MRKLLLLFLLVVSTSWLQAQANPFASGPWVGNVTAASATTAVRLKSGGVAVRWVLSESATLSKPHYSAAVTSASGAGNVVKLEAAGLKANTVYHYGFEVGGSLRTEPNSRGQFRTFPAGAASFRIAFASCGDFRHPDQRAYEAIAAEAPALFINTGDLHYSDTNGTNPDDYRRNYESVLNHPIQGKLYRSLPMAYVWDDHDYAGNDGDGTAIGRDTARRVHGEFVPHYPLKAGDGTIGQAFTIGRVRVIMTDLRSASSDFRLTDTAAKSRLGSVQKAWFKRELVAARDAGFPLILWVSSMPWISSRGAGADDWSVYATERREIANFIKSSGIKNLAVISGDMHGLAYDDGRNSDYADGGGAPLVVMHGAALTSSPSVKGGPYSGGAIGGSQQYGILEITDKGGASVQCRYLGKRAGEGVKLKGEFSAASAFAYLGDMGAPATTNPADRSLLALSSRDRISSADGVTIVGFVIGGAYPRTMLLRAVGPGLAKQGVSDPLPDPVLTLHKGSVAIAQNDNWTEGDGAQLTKVFARVGAAALSSADGKDSALVITLAPGAYTAVVRSVDGRTGTVLAEIYEVQ